MLKTGRADSKVKDRPVSKLSADDVPALDVSPKPLQKPPPTPKQSTKTAAL